MFLGFRTKEEKRLDSILDAIMSEELRAETLRAEAKEKIKDSGSLDNLFHDGKTYMKDYERRHKIFIESESVDRGDKTLLYMFDYRRTRHVQMEVDTLDLSQVDSLKHDLDMLLLLWMLTQ